MNHGKITGAIEELLSYWSKGHSIGLFVGILLVFIVVWPVWLLIRRVLWGPRESRSALEKQIDTLRVERNQWTKACTAQEKAKDEWKSHYERVAGKHKELVQRYNILLGAAKDQLGQLRKQVLDLQQEKQALSVKEENLKQQLQEALREKQDLSVANQSLNERNHALSQEGGTLRNEIEGLRLQLRGLDQTHADLLLQVSRLHQQLQGLEQQNNGLNQQALNLDEQARITKDQLDRYHRQILDLQQEKQNLSLKDQDLKQHIQDVLREKQNLSLENQSLNEKNQVLNLEAGTLREEIIWFRLQIQGLSQQSEELLRQVSGLRQEIQNLEQTNNDLHQQASSLNQMNTTITLELKERDKEASALQQQNEQFAFQNQTLSNEKREIAARNEDLLGKNQDLTQEVEKLRQENHAFREQVQALIRDLQAAKASLAPPLARRENSEIKEGEDEKGETDLPVAVPSWVGTKAIHLGLDFGTYSSKVIARVRGDQIARVLILDDPAPEYPSFVTPSLVRLKEGKLFFGQRALLLAGGKLFRSLKVSLLPPSMEEGTKDDFPLGTTPDLLVAFYLSWILGKVKNTLGTEGISRLSMNVAAPMGHLENEALKERYLHVVNAAWEAAFGSDAILVTQGAALARLRPRFEALLGRPVPNLTVRRFEILPETLAPLVSLFQHPRARPGMYMTVDMGAGTTEFSVSHLNERGADQHILCYANKSVWLGGNQFNANDQKNTAGTEAYLSEEKRLTEQLLQQFRRVWYAGFEKEKDGVPAMKDRFKKLTVILSGGGLRRKCLEAAITNNPPMNYIFMNEETSYQIKWHDPEDIEFCHNRPGLGSGDPLESLAYLAVAHGLSLERQHWREISYPKDVKPTSPQTKEKSPFDYSYNEW